jgi:hypothetical protein
MPKYRYSHYVYPVKGDRQPARFIALAVQSKEIESGRSEKIRTRKLSQWNVQVWSCAAGRAGKVRVNSGRSLSGLWALLQGPLSAPGETWLVCTDSTQTCGLIGIWERLTDGTLVWDRAGKETTDVDSPGPTHSAAGPVCLGDPPFVLSVRIPGRAGTLRIVDVRNYGFDPDRALGNLAGITASIAGGIRSIVSALAERGLGSLQTTAASQSWYSFRRKYVRHKIHVHCGRSRCQLLERELADGRGIIASVSVATRRPHLPYRRDGLVFYPTGRFRTVLCGPDLQVALASGEVLSLRAWSTYDMEPAFREYATDCLRIREAGRDNGDKPLEKWAKALGVSLVGKLAQRGRRKTRVPRWLRTFMLWGAVAFGALSWSPEGQSVTTAILIVCFFLVWVSDDSVTTEW